MLLSHHTQNYDMSSEWFNTTEPSRTTELQTKLLDPICIPYMQTTLFVSIVKHRKDTTSTSQQLASLEIVVDM